MSHVASQVGGIGSLDRKAMEAERLARHAKKRKAPEQERPVSEVANMDESRSHKKPKEAHDQSPQRKGRRTHRHNITPLHAPDYQPSSAISIQYPRGVIKKTWCFGFPRATDIKIEEVLQARTVTTAVVSSFGLDRVWLDSKFPDDSRTKFILVLHTADEQHRTSLRRDAEKLSGTRLVLPPTKFGVMHSKLMLLFHPTHLRIVVPTANCVPYDWGEEGGYMDNSVFLIDLPRLPEHHRGSANKTRTIFSEELERFLTAMEFDEDAFEGLKSFDFSATQRLRFVHSIGGSTTGATAESTGYYGLKNAVQTLKLHLPRSEPIEIDIACSSLGKLNASQLETLQCACRGLPILPKPSTPAGLSSTDNVRIMYPSVKTVDASKGGWRTAGTLFHQYWDAENFSRECGREYISTRSDCTGKGPLSHSKMILVRSKRNAHLYLGSHNFSQAAWGTISQNGQRERKCFAKNWECGVVVPVAGVTDEVEEVDQADVSTASEASDDEDEDDGDDAGAGTILPFSVFNATIDVPFQYPAQKYEEGDKPWSKGLMDERVGQLQRASWDKD